MRLIAGLLAAAIIGSPAMASDVRSGDAAAAVQTTPGVAQPAPAEGAQNAAAPQGGRAGPKFKRKSNFFATPAFALLAAGGAGGTAAAVASGSSSDRSPR
jgi:hypothetical protein